MNIICTLLKQISENQKCHHLGMAQPWQPQTLTKLTVCTSTGFAQACLESIIEEGVACRSLSITVEILTADSLWGMGNHCLQLCSTLEQTRLQQLAPIPWSLRWPWLHSVHHQINRQKLGMNIQRKDRGERQRHVGGASNQYTLYMCMKL